MPTLPPLSEREPHQARETAASFGSDAGRYDRARPSYPDAMVERIVSTSPGRDFLDVGIGTGIAARQFRAAGCEVLGVDVDARMAEHARRDGIEVEVARFEDWDAAGRTFDAVVAGQTWHWVEPAAGASKAAAILRPGGRLALFWNVPDPSPDVAAAFGAVHERFLTGRLAAMWSRSAVDAYASVLARIADPLRETGAFAEPEQWRFDWERTYTRDEWLDQVPTFGGATQLEPGQLERLVTGIGAAIDGLGGAVAMRYATVVLTASRTAGT